MKTLNIVVVTCTTLAGISALIFFLNKRRKYNNPPKGEWKYAGTLEEIMMSPIKSCTGIQLTEASCEKNGIKCGCLEDRSLVLLDKDDQMFVGDKYPEMLKIKAKLVAENELEVTAPNMEPLRLNIDEIIKGGKEVVKRVGRSFVSLVECDSEYGNWFTKVLLKNEKENGLKLFVLLKHKTIPFRKNMVLNPYMIMVDESVKDLNNRLPNPVHHWQFRGNFLIKSILPAYDEDNWKWVRIGDDAIFRYKAPCYRCIFPNINPFTCERSQDFEPLRTLKKYRMKPDKIEPEMGVYLNSYKEGIVRLGDAVYVIT